jgi:UDP-N-acetylmuramoyl-tripeptide--D-alanyl-D-alanine ligase
VVGGTMIGADVEVSGVSIDSRELVLGELFVPVVAERDGHEFIEAALERGAPAYLTAAPEAVDGPGTAVLVDDTGVALARLGQAARRRLPSPVVGITGSVGKTTTKDLVSSVLGLRLRTHASLRSFNNELGVPLTLVNAPDDTEATVVEMGARGLGHIAELCEVAAPTIGVVTTVEMVHTEMFGDLDAIARAKGELIEALPADGTAVLNADNPFVAEMAERTDARVLLVGIDAGDIRADGVELSAELQARFRLASPWGDAEVELGIRGSHNVHNALAAAAVGLVCGLDLSEVVRGLAQAEGSPWRMELRRAAGGAMVLNDAYNAGPASMNAALHALARIDARRRIAVLGPMAELGEHHEQAHREVALQAELFDIELIAVAAPDYTGESLPDIDAALDRLGQLGEHDAVLVKGSRVAGLERLAHQLLER